MARRLEVGAGTVARLLAAEPGPELLTGAAEPLAKAVQGNRGVPKTLLL